MKGEKKRQKITSERNEKPEDIVDAKDIGDAKRNGDIESG